MFGIGVIDFKTRISFTSEKLFQRKTSISKSRRRKTERRLKKSKRKRMKRKLKLLRKVLHHLKDQSLKLNSSTFQSTLMSSLLHIGKLVQAEKTEDCRVTRDRCGLETPLTSSQVPFIEVPRMVQTT